MNDFNYFKPWRRKIGLMLLMLASIFVVGWGRSQISEDSIQVPIWNNATLDLWLNQSGIGFSMTRIIDLASNEQVEIRGNRFTIKTVDNVVDEQALLDSSDELLTDTEPTIILGGSSIVCAFREVEIPHYWIITPLTLLSAYLLLSKPRSKHRVLEVRANAAGNPIVTR